MSRADFHHRARVALVGLLLLRAAVVGVPQLTTLWQQERGGMLVSVAAFVIAAAIAASGRGGNRAGSTAAQLGQTVVVLAVLTTLLAPLLTSHPPSHDPTPLSASPRWGHWFGTDGARRDVWTLTLYGGRVSLGVSVLAVAIGTALGTSVGVVAGFARGWTERALMGLTDLLLALPRLVLLLVAMGLVQGTSGRPLVVAVVLGLTGWMGIARVVRTQVLSIRELDYVTAARALGVSEPEIVWRHLLPAVLPSVAMYATLALGGTMLTEAALAFLGTGAGGGNPSWGALVAAGAATVTSAWWPMVFPTLAIAFSVVGANLLASRLEPAS